ncbi:hypothetical protein [Jiangella mangrovi]|uniref:Uncharacterized protein n=1 Tax=Jiangella mangrovi TaxID=1524084 RepID=A0A7W9GSY9_9ACTN|nr:hypothetical protein [Jiangella mangrovi]MBB5789483.1 hypothetical protein [Jiangella mangrovi]
MEPVTGPAGPYQDLKSALADAGPHSDAIADVLDEIVAERASEMPRELDLGD